MDEQSKLKDAILENDLAQIECLLADHPELVNTRISPGQTPLSLACIREQFTIVRYLLEHGADIAMRYGNNVTVLYRAVQHPEAVRLLIEYGADVNARDDKQQTPLHWAARQYDLESIRLLLEAGADLQARDSCGSTVIDVAFERGQDDYYLKYALYRHAFELGSFGILDDYFLPELSPLFRAIFRRASEDVERLLDEGADPNEERPNGRTPLFWATQLNSVDLVRRLLVRGGDLNHTDKKNVTPLHLAASRGFSDLVLLLLECGADPTIRSRDDETPLLAFLSADHFDGDPLPVLNAVIGAGTDPCSRGNQGETALHISALREQEEIVTFLLTLGCDVNAVTDRGITPLHWAAGSDHLRIISLLLDAGADVSARNWEGNTPLHDAVYESLDSESFGQCRLLLDRGADLDLRNNDGQSPRDLMRGALQEGKVNNPELKAFFQRYAQ